MAIQFHPQAGTILICDFRGFEAPEMVKRRPVIVVGPRLRKRGNLANVVPLSTTRPNEVCPYHLKLRLDPPLPAPYDSPECWVKADMVYTVGLQRLFQPQRGKDEAGKRLYDSRVLETGDLNQVLACVLHGLGLERLTQHI